MLGARAAEAQTPRRCLRRLRSRPISDWLCLLRGFTGIGAGAGLATLTGASGAGSGGSVTGAGAPAAAGASGVGALADAGPPAGCALADAGGWGARAVVIHGDSAAASPGSSGRSGALCARDP